MSKATFIYLHNKPSGMTSKEDIAKAASLLLNVCDGANKRDGDGFNAVDSNYMQWIKATFISTGMQFRIPDKSYEKMRSIMYGDSNHHGYHNQLKSFGFDPELLNTPLAAITKARKTQSSGAKMWIEDGWLFIDTPYDKQYVSKIRNVAGRRWDGNYNKIPVTSTGVEAEEAMKIVQQLFGTPPVKLPSKSFGEAFIRKNSLFQESIAFKTDYDTSYIEFVKKYGARYESESKTWEINAGTLESVEAAYTIIDKYGIEFNAKDKTVIDAKYTRLAEMRRIRQSLINESIRTDNDGCEYVKTPQGIILYPYQARGVDYGLKSKNMLLADGTGLGKTYTALGLVYNEPSIEKTVIVVPSAIKYNWQREIAVWFGDNNCHIISGRTPYQLPDTKFYIINYEILQFWTEALAEINFQFLICDEGHYAKNFDALRTKACLKLSNTDSITHKSILTATPITNKNLDVLPLLKILHVDHADLSSDRVFKRKYCRGDQTRFGTVWNGSTNNDELNILLRSTCMLRRRMEDVNLDLPDKIRSSIVLDITNRTEYNRAEADFITWYWDVKNRQINSCAEALVKINQLRQLASRGKLKSTFEFVDNLLETTEEKIILFAHHKEIQNALYAYYSDKYNTARISGGMKLEAREEEIEKFQTGDARIIVCSIKSSGTGLNLQAASISVFVEQDFLPSQLIQAEGRSLRIGSDSKTRMYYYMLAQNSIDERLMEIISAKQKIINESIDGMPENEQMNVFEELMAKMMR